MSRLFFGLAVVWILVAGPTPMSGQNRTYDDRALRIEGRYGAIRVVRGTDGAVIGKLQTFGGLDLAKVVSSSERAGLEARQFARDYGPGSVFVAAGIVGLGAWVGASKIHGLNQEITSGLLIGGTGLLVYGARRLQQAYNALARSIWWYNRDLRD